MIAGMEHTCYVCGKEEDKLINRACAAIGHSDTLILINKLVCSPCSQRLNLLEEYVRTVPISDILESSEVWRSYFQQ